MLEIVPVSRIHLQYDKKDSKSSTVSTQMTVTEPQQHFAADFCSPSRTTNLVHEFSVPRNECVAWTPQKSSQITPIKPLTEQSSPFPTKSPKKHSLSKLTARNYRNKFAQEIGLHGSSSKRRAN